MTERESLFPFPHNEAFVDWLVRGEEGSVQRERYDQAVEQWNLGASGEDVAGILGLAPREAAE